MSTDKPAIEVKPAEEKKEIFCLRCKARTETRDAVHSVKEAFYPTRRKKFPEDIVPTAPRILHAIDGFCAVCGGKKHTFTKGASPPSSGAKGDKKAETKKGKKKELKVNVEKIQYTIEPSGVPPESPKGERSSPSSGAKPHKKQSASA